MNIIIVCIIFIISLKSASTHPKANGAKDSKTKTKLVLVDEHEPNSGAALPEFIASTSQPPSVKNARTKSELVAVAGRRVARCKFCLKALNHKYVVK